jgi:hypothetical protein
MKNLSLLVLVVLALVCNGCLVTGQKHMASQSSGVDTNGVVHQMQSSLTISSPLNLPVKLAEGITDAVVGVGKGIFNVSAGVVMAFSSPPTYVVRDNHTSVISEPEVVYDNWEPDYYYYYYYSGSYYWVSYYGDRVVYLAGNRWVVAPQAFVRGVNIYRGNHYREWNMMRHDNDRRGRCSSQGGGFNQGRQSGNYGHGQNQVQQYGQGQQHGQNQGQQHGQGQQHRPMPVKPRH